MEGPRESWPIRERVAEPAGAPRARRLLTCLRLFWDDTRARSGETVGVDLVRARAELEGLGRAALIEALEELLRHHVAAALGPDSFQDVGTPRLDSEAAWGRIAERRASLPLVPSVPAPDESALEVAERLLASLEAFGPGPALLSLWRAHVEGARGGAQDSERLWGGLLDAARRDELGPAVERAAARGLAAARLDRGDPRAARDGLASELTLVACDEELAWLFAWCHLLCGELDEARELVRGLPPRAGRLPRPLAALRAVLDEAVVLLPGRAPEVAPKAHGGGRQLSRSGLSASVLGVFALAPDGELCAPFLDVTPGLVEFLPDWLRRREGAWLVHGEPEHDLLTRAAAVVLHRRCDATLRGVLGDRSLALALVPVCDREGEAIGWVRVECEHHLLPSQETLVALASLWEGEVRAIHAGAPPVAESSVTGPPSIARAPATARDERAEVLRGLIASLGLRTARRRWWGFEFAEGRLMPVDSGGEGLGQAPSGAGGRRALQRALRSRGVVAYDEPDAGLSIHPGAASGRVVPILLEGRLHGLVALESSRRRDFRALAHERLVQATAEHALAWRTAQFHRWHRSRFGQAAVLATGTPAARERLRALLLAGRAGACVALVGEDGVAQELWARWLAFEDDAQAPFHTLRDVDHLERLPRVGTWWIVAPDELPGAAQERLARAVRATRDAVGPRLVAALRTSVARASAAGRLHPELAARLAGLELFVPPLRARRNEIPELARELTVQAASELDREPPELSEEALAVLWRQPWPGNLPELAAFLRRLCLTEGARTVTGDGLRRVARDHGQKLLERLASRSPRPEDVEAALVVTAKATGAWNKTRAARWLGWDPDTLEARLRERRFAALREPPAPAARAPGGD